MKPVFRNWRGFSEDGRAWLPLLLATYFLMMASLVALTYMSLDIQAGIRGYITGESLWSKSQKDAVHYATRYALLDDVTYYERYQEALRVPLHDKRARLELERDSFDYELVYESFREGGIEPHDIPRMVRLFRWFRNVQFLDDAIAIWARGDSLIAELDVQVTAVHEAMQAGHGDIILDLLDQIHAINEELTPLEEEFSYVLSSGARNTRRMLFAGISGIAILLFVGGSVVTSVILKKWAGSHRKYAHLLETATDAILLVSGDTSEIMQVNRQAEQLTRRDAADLAGELVTGLFKQEDRTRLARLLDLLRDTEHVPIHEFRILTTHGRDIPVEISAGLTETDTGDIIQMLVRDISGRLKIESDMYRQGQEIVALVENAPDLVVHFDREYRHRYVNNAVTKVIGRPRQEIIGRTNAELGMPEELVEFWQASIQEVFDTGEEKAIEFGFEGPSGHQYFHSRLTPIRSHDGKFESVLSVTRDLTDRIKTEQNLKENQALLENVLGTALSNIMAFISVRDDDGKIVDFEWVLANQASARSIGRTLEEIIGNRLLDVLPGHLESGLFDKYVETVETGIPLQFEHYYEYDRLESWFETVAVKNGDGFVVTFSDTTEQKHALQALEKSEKRFRALTESTSAAVALIRDGKIAYANPAMASASGYEAEELFSMPLEHLFGKEYGGRLEAYERLLRTRKPSPHYFDARFRTKKGELKWFEISATLLQPDGAEPELLATGFDVTSRTRMTNELKRSQSKFMSLVNSLDGIVWEADGETFSFRFVSDQAERLLGYSVERWVAEPDFWVDHIYPPDRELAVSTCKTATAELRPHEFEYRMTASDGSLVWLRDFVAVGLEGDQVVLRGVMIDVTRQKKAEQKLAASLEEKNILLKEIHHRVKNNLQIISSLLNLQSKQLMDERDIELFRDSQHRIRSLGMLHEELYQTENLAAVCLGKYLKGLAHMLVQSFRSPTTTVAVEAEELALPLDLAIPCGLIVNELISNSLKYAFPPHLPRQTGSDEVRITVRKLPDEHAELTVRDNGAGLPEGFDLEGASTLGLRLVQILVKQINGTLNKLDCKGAGFRIIFSITRELRST